jgi:hypothetical protein
VRFDQGTGRHTRPAKPTNFLRCMLCSCSEMSDKLSELVGVPELDVAQTPTSSDSLSDITCRLVTFPGSP